MTLQNTVTGRKGVCKFCGVLVEEARLLHGRATSGRVFVGALVWRTLDAGFASTRCPQQDDGFHLAILDAGAFSKP